MLSPRKQMVDSRREVSTFWPAPVRSRAASAASTP